MKIICRLAAISKYFTIYLIVPLFPSFVQYVNIILGYKVERRLFMNQSVVIPTSKNFETVLGELKNTDAHAATKCISACRGCPCKHHEDYFDSEWD